MSNQDFPQDPARTQTPPPLPPAPAPVRRGVRPLVVAGLVFAAGLGGMVAARAVDGPGFGPAGWMRAHMGPHGWMHGPRGPGFGMMDPAMIEDRADKGIRHLSIEIDATPDQQEKLRTIVRGLVKDMLPLRETHQDMALRARSLLTQPTVDKAEIEKFRAEQIARMDSASKRVTQAITDAADVLSPEQRRKLADRLPPPGAGPFGGPR
jgi:Spy/CpxP family protein refolding chaperone